jgi:hypothetical protein
MIPEELKPSDPEPSAEREETQPRDSREEDPDTARGEAFKRSFPMLRESSPTAPRNLPTERTFSAHVRDQVRAVCAGGHANRAWSQIAPVIRCLLIQTGRLRLGYVSVSSPHQ